MEASVVVLMGDGRHLAEIDGWWRGVFLYRGKVLPSKPVVIFIGR
jgi:hypothetical protein